MPSTGIFVIGMHRSGTSAVTRVVNLLGVPLGDERDLMPPSSANPEGYWESGALRTLNDEILLALGGVWSAPPVLPPGWERDPKLDPLRDRARATFASVYGDQPVWLWKDPRNCLTLPFWLDVLDVRPIVVFSWRNPLEVWRSLEARDGFSKILAVALWERCARAALAAIPGLPAFFVPYGALLDDPELWGNELAAFLREQGVPCDWVRARAEARSFLKPALRHASYEIDTALADPDLSEAQGALAMVVEAQVGRKASFSIPSLPPETSTTEPLLAEHRRAELETAAKEQAIAEGAQQVHELYRSLVEAHAEIQAAQVEINRLEHSTMLLLQWMTELTSPLFPVAAPPTRPPLPEYPLDAQDDREAYREWLAGRTAIAAAEREDLERRLAGMAKPPRLSVIVPLYKPDLELLAECVNSVREQIYPHWELCLCDDASGLEELDRLLESWRADPRIRATRHEANRGISGATNSALALAEGDLVCFLDQDDLLHPEALGEIAAAAGADEPADVVYTDEDKMDPDGARFAPYLKPDWSPDLLTSQMYLGHLFAVSRHLVAEVGGLRSEFDGSQDYDLALRVTEKARRIAHVPRILYHWRARLGSTARTHGAKPWALRAGRAALKSAIGRRGEEARVEDGLVEGTFRVRRAIRGEPSVAIIIPFRDEGEHLRRCLDSIHARAGYDRWQAILVDNRSWKPETQALLRRAETDPRCRLLPYPHEFNWSAINNRAVEATDSDLLLFLNNDIEAVADGWLAALVEHAQRREVGAVGARLLYPIGIVQHAGVVLGLGIADHAFRFCPAEQPGYFGFGKTIRNVSAVTGACMMVRREVFTELGGFDESFHVAFNDIDFCLRLLTRGYRIVYTPYAELIHHESVSRGLSRDVPESREMLRRWLPWIRRDPYFNPNLSMRRANYTMRTADEVEPWKELSSILGV